METRGYTSLRLRMILIILAFSFIPLLLLGVTSYSQFETTFSGKIHENLVNLVENKRKTLDLFLAERTSQLVSIAYTHPYSKLTEDGYLERLLSIIQSRTKFFIDLGVIDQNGDHVAYSGPYQLQGRNYKNEEWFTKAMAQGVYVSDVFMGFRNYPHFVIAVLRREGANAWILRATIDSDVFESLVQSVQLGKRGDAFIMNTENVLQTMTRRGPGRLEEISFPKFPRFMGSRVEYITLTGESGIYGLGWLENKDWILVIREDPAEEFSPLARAKSFVIFSALAGVLLISVGAVLLTSSMVRQLARSDREKAELDASLMQSSKMAALGKMAAGVAHEVNNPLAIIKETAGWMRDLLCEEDLQKNENFKEFEEAVGKIEYHVERAKGVTHRLLGFARRMEPVEEMVDINFVLQRTLTFLENEALHRNIEIRTNLAESLPRVSSDTSQLQQVFLNIVDNAIDAVGHDGVINVGTRFDPLIREIAIDVADSGPGIPKDKLDKIFDPFFTTKKVGEGTGLGLTISFSIIEKLGGRISVESEEGKGAVFTIHLPVA